MLFYEPQRERLGWLNGTEPSIRWFTDITSEEAARSRAHINQLYENFPGKGNNAYLSALMSEDTVDHLTALDELAIAGRLKPHPGQMVVYEEGGRGPDFRIYEDTALKLSIEVLSLFERDDWARESQQSRRIAELIQSNVPVTTHAVGIDVKCCDREPRQKPIIDFVRSSISQLQDSETVPPEHFGESSHQATYQTSDASIIIEFSFYSIPIARRGQFTDIVWMVGGTGGVVNSAQRLKRSLEKKLRKGYELRGEPFALCVSIHDISCSLYQVEAALFGGERVCVDTGEVIRSADGFFGPSSLAGSWHHSNVSAVLVFRNWNHADVDACGEMLCLKNPQPSKEFPAEFVACNYELRWVVEGDNLTTKWWPCKPSDR